MDDDVIVNMPNLASVIIHAVQIFTAGTPAALFAGFILALCIGQIFLTFRAKSHHFIAHLK